MSEDILKTVGQVKDAFSKYIVRPINAFGLGGFVFDVEGDSSAVLSADITDHYTENNSSIQDHIALRPKRVTLSTYVGELVHRRDGSTDTFAQKLSRKLNVVNSYLPQFTSGMQQAFELSNKNREEITFDSALRNAADIWGVVKNLNPPVPRQQQAYMYFKALFETKQLVALQTPFEYMTNMAIENLVSTQSEETNTVTNFSITLKEIRRVSVKNEAFEFVRQLDPTAAQQRTESTNGGSIQGSPRTSSVLLEPVQKWGILN